LALKNVLNARAVIKASNFMIEVDEYGLETTKP